MISKAPTRLDTAVEDLIYDIIGACITVHRELGPGMIEAVYQRALAVELEDRGISHAVEALVPVRFKDHVLCHHRVDLIVGDAVIVEIKAVDRLAPVHTAQAWSYLRASGLHVALLVNFNVAVLKAGIRRIVL